MVAMRVWFAIAIAGCSFAPTAIDVGHTTIVDDSAADFAAGTRDRFAIDPLGMMLGERYGEVPVAAWNGHPLGLAMGVTNSNFTLVYDGEIYLPEGATAL